MYDLVPDELQRSVIDSAREVAEATLKEPSDPWGPVASSGLLGLGVSEEAGGVGAGAAEEVLAFVELGAALVDPTLLAQVLAAHVLVAGGEVPVLALDAVLAGDQRLALADPWRWSFDGAQTDTVRVVLPAEGEPELATLVSPRGVSLVRLLDVEVLEGFDKGARIARARAEAISAERPELLDRALALRAALQTGLARRVLEISVEHATTRQQFGKPIGSFQAVKHHLAGMAVQLDAAQALAFQAAVMLDAGPGAGLDVSDVARSATVVAGRGAVESTRTGIQVHGGIGVTDECEMHGFLRRAHLWEQTLGSPDHHEEWLVQQAVAGR